MSGYLVPALSGVGTFLVGFVSSPLLEILKADLLRRSARTERRRELIAKLRIMLGHMDAITDRLNAAVGLSVFSSIVEDQQATAWSELNAFDVKVVRDFASELTRTELSISADSGIGQSLVKRIILYASAAEYLRRIKPTLEKIHDGFEPGSSLGEKPKARYTVKLILPERSKSVVEHFRECDRSLRRFIAGPYAQKLGIDSLSLTIDNEIFKWDIAMADWDADVAFDEAARLWDRYIGLSESKRGEVKPTAPAHPT